MKKKILFGLFAFVAVAQLAFATSTWSDAYTYELTGGGDWKRQTTVGEYMGNLKDSNTAKYDVYTVSKTMWSSPSFRVVNSNNAVVAGSVTTAPAGQYSTKNENTGTIGYAYYGSVKPAWNQLGTDRIKLQFRVY